MKNNVNQEAKWIVVSYANITYTEAFKDMHSHFWW